MFLGPAPASDIPHLCCGVMLEYPTVQELPLFFWDKSHFLPMALVTGMQALECKETYPRLRVQAPWGRHHLLLCVCTGPCTLRPLSLTGAQISVSQILQFLIKVNGSFASLKDWQNLAHHHFSLHSIRKLFQSLSSNRHLKTHLFHVVSRLQ